MTPLQLARQVTENYYTATAMIDDSARKKVDRLDRHILALDEPERAALAEWLDEEILDGLKGSLATSAANQIEDEDDQESAIGICEHWVASSIANSGPRSWVLAVLAVGLCRKPVVNLGCGMR